jgi:hypothetical protein
MPSKEIIIESIKEFFRVIVIAIIPIIISNLSDNVFNWKVVAIAGAIAGLKFIDKLMHLTGAAREEEGTVKKPVESALTTGLTRF